MSHTNGTQAETTAEERKPPTLADIVREKTDDGRRIIDFFLDVMEDRVDGAQLCHRMDAAKQLVKYGSKDAARFIARYRGVPCGHATRGRRDPADPCSAADAAGRESAPAPFTEDLLTVLSAVDEDLMAKLVRAQTADGSTVIEFLDDVMQDRVDGFRCHHRIAAAKELIVHIVRDEQPEAVPRDTSVSVSAQAPSSVRAEPGSPEPVERVEAQPVVPAEAGTHPAPNSTVVPAKSLAPEQSGAGTHPLNPEPVLSTVEEPVLSLPKGPAGGPTSVHPELVEGPDPEHQDNPTSVHPEPAEGPSSVHPELVEGPDPEHRDSTSVHPEPVEGPDPEHRDSTSVHPEPVEGPRTFAVPRPRRRRTRKQRRQHGAARAAVLGKGSERNNKEEQDKPTPVELTIAERRIKERLQQHWHEPDPYGAPIDSTTPSRSPPW